MDNRIEQTWKSLTVSGGKAVIPYVTPDFPVRGCTADLVHALCEAGADLVEIGIPFSDPLADGPVIQAASHRALENGSTPHSVLGIAAEIRRRTSTPIVLMGYTNPIMRLGVADYCRRAADAGVDGLIIPDLPPEESAPFRAEAEASGLSMVFLIAPTSSDDRVRSIDALSTHFSYCVSITGVTGNKQRFADTRSLDAFLRRVRHTAHKPFVVGFGISTAEDIRRVTLHADGAVVGSALLRAIEAASTGDAAVRAGVEFFRSLRPAATSGQRVEVK